MTYKLNKVQGYLLVIDDESKVLAHLPLDGYPVKEGVPLLPPIEDDVEISQWVYDVTAGIDDRKLLHDAKLFLKDGYNKAKEKYKYTEEDMRKAIAFGGTKVAMKESLNSSDAEEFIQSIHQYPTEFECEVEHVLTIAKSGYPGSPINIPKTITTAHGIQWVGKYK